ncbi:P-loop NTPase fold protein [Kribbella sp. CA-253562]|uniref:P-loop NTPase fold protein n=1 Tax=Kribbella sp. CA-253562 TaxID=3239942 RepID=UPI003D935A36
MSQASGGSPSGRSASFAGALRWAEASAALRGAGRPVTESDLFLGTLLAHPDPDGEMRRLIGHFGLTARDLLPDDFPKITLESLRHAAATVGSQSPGSQDEQVYRITVAADRLAGSRRPPMLADLVGALLTESQTFRQALQRPLDRFGFSVGSLADQYRAFLRELNPRDEVAGAKLGEWLARTFPRRPASLAGFSSDVVDPTADFVDVSIEADAFAYLISSRTLVPPLAIGLFGQWGSGKSFLMAKIRHRIQQLNTLAASSAQAAPAVWPNVAHIEFNAWEYVETNLWAALLDKIFDELSPAARQTLSDLRRAGIQQQLDTKKSEVSKADRALEGSQVAEAKAADAVRAGQQQLDAVERTTGELRESMIAGELESVARVTLVETVVAAGKDTLGAEATRAVTDAVDDVRRAVVATRTSPWLQKRFWTAKRVGYVTLAAVAVPVVAFVLDLLSAPPLTSVAASVAAVAPLAALGLKAIADFTTQQQAALADAERRVDEQLAAAVTKAKEELVAAGKELRAKQEAVELARTAAEQAHREQVELEEQREAATAGRVLADFLADREASDDYRSQLGLISKVRQDLQDLAELTAEFNQETPRAKGGPPNRIVLYIDDLDRCPPRKVVEVLEAVHLLLSFPLFVVVVAVDTRWLTSALHDALPALDQKPGEALTEQPKAMDYVEKIFQIPFWVEDLDDDARRRLLRGLLLPSVAAQPIDAGGAGNTLQVGRREEELVTAMLTDYGSWLDVDARHLALSVDELAFIESLAPLIGATPRRVKRFVNICQLLLAMAPPLSAEGDQPTERMATCFMAAVHEGSPRLASRLAASPPSGAASTLSTSLTALGADELTAERERVRTWLRKYQELHPATAKAFELTPMSRFLVRFDLIRRLTFETGPGSVV